MNLPPSLAKRGSGLTAFVLLVLFILLPTNLTNAVEICEIPPQAGAWDLADNATIDIPIGFDVEDVATDAYAVDVVKVNMSHTYAGDLGGRLFSPSGASSHLWQLGDGSVAPSTGASNCGRDG